MNEREIERLRLIAEALDDQDKLNDERAKFLKDWRLRREQVINGLNMLREDERQMRLDEQEGA